MEVLQKNESDLKTLAEMCDGFRDAATKSDQEVTDLKAKLEQARQDNEELLEQHLHGAGMTQEINEQLLKERIQLLKEQQN